MGGQKEVGMPDNIRSDEVNAIGEAAPLRERLRPLQARVLSRPSTGLEADKAFYDDINGDFFAL